MDSIEVSLATKLALKLEIQVRLNTVKKLGYLAEALTEDDAEDLLPILQLLVNDPYCHDEVLLALSEQLRVVMDVMGGHQHIDRTFSIAEKLACIDDNIIRAKTVDALVGIASDLEEQQVSTDLIPFINKLATHELFSGRCSASAMFTICYSKVKDDENRFTLRNMFLSLCKDEVEFVRKSCARYMEGFLDVVEAEFVKEFVPAFVDLANDNQDDVRCTSIPAGLSLAHHLTAEEVKEQLLETFLDLWRDRSWKVKMECIDHTEIFQTALGPDITTEYLLPIFTQNCTDKDMRIRKTSASKLGEFCKNIHDNLDNDKSNSLILKTIMPIVQDLSQDGCEEVREEVLHSLKNLITFMGAELTKIHIMPILYGIINSDFNIHECFVYTFNEILDVTDVNNMFGVAEKVITSLLDNNKVSWRAKRSITITLAHLIQSKNLQICNELIQPSILKLLHNECLSVRRSVVIILPFLIKQYGPAECKNFLKNNIFALAEHTHYLMRILFLYCVEELLFPSLDVTLKFSATNLTFLQKVQDALKTENSFIYAARVLLVIDETLKEINAMLAKDWVKINVCNDIKTDDVFFYAQDTLVDLEKVFCCSILSVNEDEILNSEDRSYLEGIFARLPEILKIIRFLKSDKVDNVKQKAANTLGVVRKFVNAIEAEISQSWVQEAILKIPENDEIFNVITRKSRCQSTTSEESCDLNVEGRNVVKKQEECILEEIETEQKIVEQDKIVDDVLKPTDDNKTSCSIKEDDTEICASNNDVMPPVEGANVAQTTSSRGETSIMSSEIDPPTYLSTSMNNEHNVCENSSTDDN